MSSNYYYEHLNRQAQQVHYDMEKALSNQDNNVHGLGQGIIPDYTNGTTIYSVSRANEVDDNFAGDYGGAFYSNLFRPHQHAKLYDIGFYGPANANPQKASCSYNVHIELFEAASNEVLATCRPSNLIAKKITNVLVGNTENIFYVSFGNVPISLKSCKWYLIQFKLEGPKTKRAAYTLYDAAVIGLNGNLAKFSFSEGSKQMPILRFII